MIHMYRTRRRGRVQWRWQLTHLNGRILAASSESYSRRAACLHNLRTITRLNLVVGRNDRSGSFHWPIRFKPPRRGAPREFATAE